MIILRGVGVNMSSWSLWAPVAMTKTGAGTSEMRDQPVGEWKDDHLFSWTGSPLYF